MTMKAIPTSTKIIKGIYWKAACLFEPKEKSIGTLLKKKNNKTLWPLFMDGVQLPQG